MHFSHVARTVYMVVRGGSLKSTLSKYLLDRIAAAGNIRVLTHCEVTAIEGDENLRSITITNQCTGDQTKYDTRWLFICIGGGPNTAWAGDVGIIRDESGATW